MAGPDGNPNCPLNATWPAGGYFDSSCIRALQWRLNHLGQNPPLAEDGGYGPLTSKALEIHIGLDQDSDLYPGWCPDAATLQGWIVACGFGVAVDSDWGPLTTQGLKLALNAGRM